MIANSTAYGTAGDTDYTGPDYEQFELRCIAAHLVSVNVVKEAFYEDFGLDLLLGGKVQRCYSRELQEWGWNLLYYRVTAIRQLKAQVSQLRPPARCSGFVLPSRGRHWHRASQLRRN